MLCSFISQNDKKIQKQKVSFLFSTKKYKMTIRISDVTENIKLLIENFVFRSTKKLRLQSFNRES